MKTELKNDLEALICEGNVAKLPSTPLQDYAGLKKALVKATGKYKSNTFVFPTEAQTIIDMILTGEVVDFKKKYQFFATPTELAEIMCNEIIGCPIRVLEPSAGHGALIDALLEVRPEVSIHAIEMSDLNFKVLEDKYGEDGRVKLSMMDFMNHDPLDAYDLILANPPFTKNQDIDHILRMYKLLAPGGQLITLSSMSWTFGQQSKQVAFREFVDEQASISVELGQGSFKTSGTGVGGMLLVFNK